MAYSYDYTNCSSYEPTTKAAVGWHWSPRSTRRPRNCLGEPTDRVGYKEKAVAYHSRKVDAPAGRPGFSWLGRGPGPGPTRSGGGKGPINGLARPTPVTGHGSPAGGRATAWTVTRWSTWP